MANPFGELLEVHVHDLLYFYTTDKMVIRE